MGFGNDENKEKRMRRILILIVALGLLGACAQQGSDQGQVNVSSAKGSCYDAGVNGFGSHFQSYLNSTGNSDLTGFGGSTSISGDCAPVNQPVVFVHGNGDDSKGDALPMGGWGTSRDYFISKGYKSTELYSVNWGLPGMTNSAMNYHNPLDVDKVHRFIEAVNAYTGKKVDVISHSLGVTIARRAAMGGNYSDYAGNSVTMGSSLHSVIDTFVGIAGGNRGLNSCGVWPLNVWAPSCGPHGLSISNPFFSELQGGSAWPSSMKVGSYTFSIKSWVDEIVCMGSCYIYWYHSSSLKGENGYKSYYSAPYGHMGIKEYTGYYQYKMVKEHKDY